jgi:uncharacterized protein
MIALPGLPELTWLNGFAGRAEADGATLTMTAPPKSDMFNNPLDLLVNASVPALCFTPTGDFALSAKVSVEFASGFDGGVLIVHQGPEDYAKLCFEATPDLEPMAVSVVTRGVSDDANGPVIDGTTLWLRVTRLGPTFAFHHSLDGMRWHFTRWFQLRNPDAPIVVGMLAQSPMGEGCRATFANVTYRQIPVAAYDERAMASLRNGS